MASRNELDELTEAECLELLAGAVVGRFVFTIDALPAVVPVAFAVHRRAVVCRTGASTRLAGAADGGVLAVQADSVDPTTRTGWSVVGTGVAEIVRDPAEVSGIEALVQPWVDGADEVAIRLPLTVLTGRRIGVAGAAHSGRAATSSA